MEGDPDPKKDPKKDLTKDLTQAQKDIVGNDEVLSLILKIFGKKVLYKIKSATIEPTIKEHLESLRELKPLSEKEWVNEIKGYRNQHIRLHKQSKITYDNPLKPLDEPVEPVVEPVEPTEPTEPGPADDEEPEKLEEPLEGPEDSEPIVSERSLEPKTVSQHRKAFVNWVSNDLYKRVQAMVGDSPLKVYQLLVQTYLATETPYRGLLVYHGLGTGKTASAISLAEGLSKKYRINTILPASLETEFIKEVQRWGQNELNKEGLWRHLPYKEQSKETLKELAQEYYLTQGAAIKILSQTRKEVKALNTHEAHDQGLSKAETTALLKKANESVTQLKGFFVPDPKGQKLEEFDEISQIYILKQIDYLIQRKYNFIHYRPFPKVEKSSLKEFLEGEDEEEEDVLLDDVEETQIKTSNQKIVADLEKRLAYNQKTYSVNSPFYGEAVIVDEVHNLVRQILNGSKPSRIFYEWIINAQDVKLIFLSGTPFINKPSEIAILYNMLKGLIRIYTFTLTSTQTVEEITETLQSVYEKPSSIELFHVEQKGGKTVVSFVQESTGFESLMDPKDNIVYTIKTDDHPFQEFIHEIYEGLHKITKPAEVTPSKTTFDKMSAKELKSIRRGEPKIYDKDAEIVFNRQQKLFDIYEDNRLTDMTVSENFEEYFFGQGDTIESKKRVLLKRMLMGMTSYYPIDRSSIVDMPQIVKPDVIPEAYKEYPIVKDMNIVPCLMSKLQFEKYVDALATEKSQDRFRTMQQDGEAPYHYHTRTRQACNIVFRNDDFRTTKKRDKEAEKIVDEMKEKAYGDLMAQKMLEEDNDLSEVSPKMFQILQNMAKFTKEVSGKKVSTGKVLFYSDFRADAGSEAFELVLRSNGYERFDSKAPQERPGLRYTFITGSEGSEERRINRDHYNDEQNKFGEYIQIMIISSAGAEGISLKCVRQVHILEPYWNYVRIDQVLGRAIRMRSHEVLEKSERNVEQYLYVSAFLPGTNLDEVYESIKSHESWSTSTGIPLGWTNVKAELSKGSNRGFKDLLESVVKTNIDTRGETIDQKLFEVMSTKYKVSLEMNAVIRESSLDCIQHTRDDPELNDRCLRFSSKLQHEIAYFPGMGYRVLENTDIVQLRSKTLYHIKPNIYVVSMNDPETTDNLFVYYRYNGKKEKDTEMDIRYLRDNASRLCDVNVRSGYVYQYVSDKHELNERLGKEFSVYQEIFHLDPRVVDTHISQEKFPKLELLVKPSAIDGYRIKSNVKGTHYYLNHDNSDKRSIMRVKRYTDYVENSYSEDGIRTLVVYDGELYSEE